MTYEVEKKSDVRHDPRFDSGLRLNDSSRDYLVALAILGLMASISDGEADAREVTCFMRAFDKQCGALGRFDTSSIVRIAVRRIRSEDPAKLFDSACDCLRENSSEEQCLVWFDHLANIVIADGRVDEREETYLDLVAGKLGIAERLMRMTL